MGYVNLYDVQSLIPNTNKNLIPDKFTGVDWVNAYGEYLSVNKYNGMDWKVMLKVSHANRGNTGTFPEIASMYLEWLSGVSGWELKNRIAHLIYPTQTIYFLQCQEFQKIGISENFKSRLSTIQNATPFNVEVITTNEVQDAREHEKRLLLKYYSKRVSGEWFKFNFAEIQDIKKYIESIELTEKTIVKLKQQKKESGQLSLFA